MNIWLWVVVLGLAAWVAHWGADQLLTPLTILGKQWGLTALAGVAFIAIVTASPVVAANITCMSLTEYDIVLRAITLAKERFYE